MAVSLNTLRQRIRSEIRAEHKNNTVLSSALNATDTSALVTIGEGDRISAGDLLEVESEVLRVRENPMPTTFLNSALNSTDTYMQVDSVSDLSAGYNLRIGDELMLVTATSASVYLSAERAIRDTGASEHDDNASVYNPDALLIDRGMQGTSGVSHAASTQVDVVDVWTGTEIDQSIQDAVRYMVPYFYEDYKTYTKEFGTTTTNSRLGDFNTAANVAAFSATEDAVTPTHETTSYQTENGAMNIGLDASQSANTYGTYTAGLSNAVNATSADYLNFWFYAEELRNPDTDVEYFNINMLELKVGNDGSNQYQTLIPRAEISEGWNMISVPYKNGVQTGSVVNSAIDYVELTVYENEFAPADIALGDLKVGHMDLAPYPMTNSAAKIDLPKHVEYIANARTYSNGSYDDIQDFQVRGNDGAYNMQFTTAPTQGQALELLGAKRYEFDDDNNLNIPEYMEEFIVTYSSRALIENRMPDLLRYDKYSSKTEREDGTRLDYIRNHNLYTQRITDFLDHHAKSLDAQKIDFGQR